MELGVIGGLGPMATAYFMELVTAMTKADSDQEHISMAIYSNPQIPDRTAYILDHSRENPLPEIARLGKLLQMQDVRCVAIPCITAHYFHDEIEKETGLHVIHAIRDTAALLKDSGIRRVGIMATDGTIQSRIFQDVILEYGMEAVIPKPDVQSLVMSLIYDNIKAGLPVSLEHFCRVRDAMKAQGAEVIVLGCTELSLIKKEYPGLCRKGYLDVMEVLARSSVLACGHEVKAEYEVLFTPFS